MSDDTAGTDGLTAKTPKMPPRGSVASAMLAELLAPSLGEALAHQTIERACKVVGCSCEHLRRDEALRVLEHVAEQPGLVGIAGRFAKSRVLLEWK